MNIYIKFILILVFLIPGYTNIKAQYEDSDSLSIVILKPFSEIPGRRRQTGKIIKDNSQMVFKPIYGDTMRYSKVFVSRYFSHDQVRVFKRNKFQYKQGLFLNYTNGFSNSHFNTNFTVTYRLPSRFEFGFGVGFHFNSFFMVLSSEFVGIETMSVPTFITGKYIVNKGKRLLYAKAKIGLANNTLSGTITEVSNGLFMEGGIGLKFAARRRFRGFVELSQYSSSVSAHAYIPDVNGAPFNSDFRRVYQKIVFTYGVEFGQRAKRRISLYE